MAIEAGDTVKLKSGGPIMTVQDIDDYTLVGATHTTARCYWFDGNEKKEGLFDIKGLRKEDV